MVQSVSKCAAIVAAINHAVRVWDKVTSLVCGIDVAVGITKAVWKLKTEQP